jgi:hypothetical protein
MAQATSSVTVSQQLERHYEVLTVDERRLLAARLAELALQFIALREVVVAF